LEPAEFGIASALSGAPAMMLAYGSGDPYLALIGPKVSNVIFQSGADTIPGARAKSGLGRSVLQGLSFPSISSFFHNFYLP
jgi:hypothetical protein